MMAIENELETLKNKLKEEKKWYNRWSKMPPLSIMAGCMKWQISENIKVIEKRIKELETKENR